METFGLKCSMIRHLTGDKQNLGCGDGNLGLKRGIPTELGADGQSAPTRRRLALWNAAFRIDSSRICCAGKNTRA
jgi:hypothetical protein